LKDRFVDRYKYPYFVVHRRDLHAALVETCRREPHFSFEEGEVDSYEQRDGYVEVNCSDGRTMQARAMIGCEGLRSKTRARIVGDTPRSTGYVVYRGLVPVEEISNKEYLNSMVVYGGPGCHIVQYRLRGGTVMNNVATFQSPAYARGEADYGGVEEFKAAYDKCAPEVRDMLKYFALDKNWLLHDVQPATNWTDGNVTLLGDSAHATLQYLAQGAIMAMEDALVLAHEVAQQPNNVNAAFMKYQDQRLNRTARVITTARLFGAIVHAREGERLLRNELAKSRDVDIPWEVDWLYQGANLLDKID
jgi:salicylate hydroxylase